MNEDLSKRKTPERDAHGRLLPGNTANPKGNPNGRPPAGTSMAETLRKYLDMPVRAVMGLDINAMLVRDAICVTMIYRGLMSAEGERDRETIFDRVDGRPRQAIEISAQSEEKLALLQKIADSLPERRLRVVS